jgi:hypothetical protein
VRGVEKIVRYNVGIVWLLQLIEPFTFDANKFLGSKRTPYDIVNKVKVRLLANGFNQYVGFDFA